MPEDQLQGFTLSPQQLHVWELQTTGSDGPYRAAWTALVKGDLDPGLLLRAVQGTAARHEILRTSFRRLPGTAVPLQVIQERAEVDFAHVDLRAADPEGQEAELRRLDAEREAPLRWDGGPVLRVRLATLAGDRHRLSFDLPALCADGASLELLADETLRRCAGRDPDREIVQYADVAAWENDLLTSEETREGRRLWERRDFFDSSTIALPYELPAAAGEPFAPEVEWASLPPHAARAIAALALEWEMSPAAVVLAGFHAVLARLAGASEVTVGAAFDGRKFEELEHSLGLFVRHLPVTAEVGEETTFETLAAGVAAELEELARVEEYFSWTLVPGWGEGREEPPWMPWAFRYDEREPRRLVAGRELEEEKITACTERFTALLVAVRRGAELELELHHDPRRLGAAAARTLLAQCRALLAAAAERPEAPLRELPLATEEERAALIERLAGAEVDFGPPRGLYELFELQARETPECIAVAGRGVALTYGELDGRSLDLAERLRGRGLRAEDRVALFLERSPEMIVALLGVLRAGGAYVALDTAHPEGRLEVVLADVAPRMVVTTEDLAERLPASTPKLLVDRRRRSEAPAEIALPELSRLGVDRLAYVLYTSGSTGRPKGVMVSHRAIANRLLWMQRELPIEAGDRILHKTPIGFDASIWEIFVPLLAGATVVVAAPDAHRDTSELAATLDRERITVLQLVPTLMASLLDEPQIEAGALRRLFAGGERLTATLRDRAFRRFESAELHNLYGPTEAAIDATHWHCVRGEEGPVVPIGNPLHNLRLYLVDAAGEQVATGEPGEVYIGGVGLARGYFGRPGLTAERLLPDPFAGAPGARTYRTGDLGRVSPEGTLEFLGRLDAQVKIRGVRVEPGEVEAVLAEHPDVATAAVVARPAAAGHLQLAAYVVPRPGGGSEAGDARTVGDGLKISALNENEADLLYEEIFAEGSYLRHGVELADGDRVFDVGANVGLFSLFVHDRCRQAQVYAFEPVAPVREKLEQNVERYGLPVRVRPYGLLDTAGERELVFYPRWSGMSGVHGDAAEDASVTRAFLRNQVGEDLATEAEALLADRFEQETLSCSFRRLSDVVREEGIERIDLLKVDVEKSEMEVLEGIDPEHWSLIDQVVVEAHDAGGRSEAVVELLRAKGYEVSVDRSGLLADTGLCNVYAVHPRRRSRPAPASRRLLPRLTEGSTLEQEVRQALAARLPDSMIPAELVVVDALPRTPSGKVDRRRLAEREPGTERGTGSVPASTPEEVSLVDIWRQVLGVEVVGIHDNFFELGGDSILGLQVASRARQAGLQLKTQDLFQFPTVAELARQAAGSAPSQAAPEESEPAAPVLTPIQHRFFEADLPSPHHFNQSVLLEVRAPLPADRLERALAMVAERHDALRLRFSRSAEGPWTPSSSEAAAPPVEVVDLSDVAREDEAAELAGRGAGVQASLDLARGPLLRAALFERGPDRPALLLVVAHHLVIDAVSWRVMFEDLEWALSRLESGDGEGPPPATTSYARWSRRLAEHAASGAVDAELPYWRRVAEHDVPPLPLDHPEREPTAASSAAVTCSLGQEATEALLRRVPEVYQTRIDEVLLTALGQAVTAWSGGRRLRLDREGHGREEDLVGGVDLSRTVGWFTVLHPLAIELPADSDPGAAIMSVKEQVRAVPNGGIGYGLLRYLSPDPEVRRELAAMPAPELCFNYLGQYDPALSRSSRFALATQAAGPGRAPEGRLEYVLQIDAHVAGGELRTAWTYSNAQLETATVERLSGAFLAALERLIDHCLSPEAGGYTPSDFPDAAFDQEGLDRVLDEVDFET